MLRADTEYSVVWDGSKDRNRGYLAVVAEPTRPAPPLQRQVMEDWSVKGKPKPTLLERVVEHLSARRMTSRELQQAIGVTQSAIDTALGIVRQTGKLRHGPAIGTLNPGKRANIYWMEP